MRHRIVMVEEYGGRCQLLGKWYEIHYLRKSWWKGEYWEPLEESCFSFGGPYWTPVRFATLAAAQEYLKAREKVEPYAVVVTEVKALTGDQNENGD